MKRCCCIALLVIGFAAHAQEVDVVALLTAYPVLQTAYESATLSLDEKKTVIDEQVAAGNLTERQARALLAAMVQQRQAEATMEYRHNH